MADSTEADTNLQYLGLLVPALIVLIFGLVIHSFIIGINVNDWWKGRSVTLVDHIVTSLGISRMCTQFVITLYLFVAKLLLLRLDSDLTLVVIDAVYVFFIYANIWLTSLLSIVFCLKISNLHTRLFLCLKTVILKRTVYFFVALVLLSTLNSLIPLLLGITEFTKRRTHNTTKTNLSMDCIDINSIIYNYTIGSFFPLFFYYISSVLLFTSLYHHTAKMKMTGNLTINLETYYSAMKFVSFTFIYQTIYFIGHCVYAFHYYFYCAGLLWLCIVLDFLPAVHSSYLIYRIAKLRNQMFKILRNGTDCLFQIRRAEASENTM